MLRGRHRKQASLSFLGIQLSLIDVADIGGLPGAVDRSSELGSVSSLLNQLILRILVMLPQEFKTSVADATNTVEPSERLPAPPV